MGSVGFGTSLVVPALPSTSSLHSASWSSVLSATAPVQVVVRSRVASWIATGTPSCVSFASTSSHQPSREAFRKAGMDSSG